MHAALNARAVWITPHEFTRQSAIDHFEKHKLREGHHNIAVDATVMHWLGIVIPYIILYTGIVQS